MAERKLNANAKRFEDYLKEKGITRENRKTLAEINEMAKADGVELFKTGSLNSVVNGDLTIVKAVKEQKEVVQVVKKTVNTYFVEQVTATVTGGFVPLGATPTRPTDR